MECITTEFQQGVYTITLNRPEVYNGFNMQMAKEVQEAIDHCSNDDNVRAVVITAKGKAFSSGQDLKEATAENAPSMRTILMEQYNPLILKICNCPKPIIAAINGVAAGAGANIALACDIVIATRSATFIQAFSKIGLVPDSGGTYFLPKLIGMQKAMALAMTGDSLTAQDAWTFGLVYKVYEDETFYEDVNAFAFKIAQMPTKALAYTKKLIHMSQNNTLQEQLQSELEYQEKCGEMDDYKEGVNAFIQKRKPVFHGK